MSLSELAAPEARAERVRAVRAAGSVNGIAFVEVASADQRTLAVSFVHPLPGEAGAVPAAADPLTAANIRITGGVRVTSVTARTVSAAGRVLTVTVDQPGDFSPYVLALVAAPGSDAAPAGFDPVLSRIGIDFKSGCPSDLDCRAPGPAGRETPAPPPIDYLAKDWPSFRRAMLDRMSVTAPDWQERSPADTMVTMVEALAYAADRLSYMQDAAATEAYLGTARLRPSLRRHARLLDYRVHEGCNARTWIAVEVAPGGGADGALLPRGTPVLALGAEAPPVLRAEAAAEAIPAADAVFETMQDTPLAAARNAVALHDWSGALPVLAAGATEATLRRSPGLALTEGEVIVLEQTVSPATGLAADADPALRAAVRLTEVRATTDPLDGTDLYVVRWAPADALGFDLPLRAETLAGGAPAVVDAARALANVVPADHGRTIAGAPGLAPAAPVAGRAFRPRLARRDITFAAPFDPAAAARAPAAAALAQDPRDALPAVSLEDGAERWRPQRDLLGAGRFAREFVVEPDGARGTFLRFGDDIHGKAPATGTAFTATLRVGNGPAGNLGPDSLTTLVAPLDGIASVRNPLPAEGGRGAEAAEAVRRYAPEAFRTQARAVTAADWTRVAEALPEVARARAELRWTGSWHTVFLTVDRQGGGPVQADAAFAEGLLGHLDAYRVAGYDLALRDPVFRPLEIELLVCLSPGYVPGDLRARLAQVFSAGPLAGGGRGFFHPDNFTFGDRLYLSQIHAAAQALDGVASVQPVRFHPRGATPAGEIAAGVIDPGEAAILRCDNDPNRPENGTILFDVREAA